jgi:23S rRNA pseudouridine1911/1915/1917 synthase
MNQTIKLSSPATHEFWEIPVLYEDAHLLALDKPTGLLTSPSREAPDQPSLMRLLHAGILEGKPWARERGLTYLMNAHRLDFETSGVILLARSKPALVALANLFGAEKTVQRYLALVQGEPAEDRFEVEAAVAPHPSRPGLMHVDPRRGKRSRTLFTVQERFAGWTLLKCEPQPNRPHQLRVHLRRAGLPLAGDSLYGGPPLLLSKLKRVYRLKPHRTERPLLARAALHAEELVLAHPVSGDTLTLTAPWPKDFAVAVKYLRRYAGRKESGESAG